MDGIFDHSLEAIRACKGGCGGRTQINGLAEVTAVRACPPIAEGEGRVVTGRFVTRDVANVVRITLTSGTEIRATDVHPVWSIDREDWVPAGKLEPGEHVDTLTGPVAVVRVEQLDRHSAVYNLEVHGEHVYRIAVDGVLVHNAGPTCNILENAADGTARQLRVQRRLEGAFPNARVQSETYLRTADGRRALDASGSARRLDHVVIENGRVRYIVETTSKTADKTAQLVKELNIRAAGGNYIRDRITGLLIDVREVATRITRRQ